MTDPDRIRLPDAPQDHLRVDFAPDGDRSDPVHLLHRRDIHAINAAIAAGRPLLVRGEPGIGKSQLARAAATALRRAYVRHVVDSSTESHDLMWTFDAVRRLADAQLAGALRHSRTRAQTDLAVRNYLQPGPLWWAFNWDSARTQSEIARYPIPPQPDGGDPANGAVLLLDEIDKAESEVPNGLLEALGAREFTPFGRVGPVRIAARPPLLVITTNEERTLPDAFVRRCLVLHLTLPTEEEAFVAVLLERGTAHFPRIPEAIRLEAARMLFHDRQEAIRAQVQPRPGQAEYLDLLRAVEGLAGSNAKRQREMLDIAREYTLQKHQGHGSS